MWREISGEKSTIILAWRSRQCADSGVQYPGNVCLLRLIVLPRWSAWPSSQSARMICCCCCVHFFSISEAARERGSLIAVRKQQTVACWQSGIIRFPIHQHRDHGVGRILIFTPSQDVNQRRGAETDSVLMLNLCRK